MSHNAPYHTSPTMAKTFDKSEKSTMNVGGKAKGSAAAPEYAS